MYESIIDGFRELSSRGEHPNFIFVGGSLFQLAGLDAFISEKQAQGIDMCGVVCDWITSPHRRQIQKGHMSLFGQKPILLLQAGKDFDLALGLKENVKETFRQSLRLFLGKPILADVFTDENPLYFFYPAFYEPNAALWNTVLAISDHVKYIQYDEGLGTYVVSDAAKKQKAVPGLRKGLRAKIGELYEMLNGAISKRLEKVRSKRVQTEEYLLFSKKNNHCSVNDHRAKLYANAFSHFSALQGIKDCSYENKVVIVGFDFAKLGDTIPFELIVFEKIKEACKKNGADIIFRPHPSQSKDHSIQYQQLDMEFSDYPEIPLESILGASADKPLAIVGLGSTAQVTASAFWDVPSISIEKLLKNELMGRIPSNEVLEFVFCQHEMVSDLFADYLITPKSYQDLDAIISEILGAARA